jgi:hypothetical protein
LRGKQDRAGLPVLAHCDTARFTLEAVATRRMRDSRRVLGFGTVTLREEFSHRGLLRGGVLFLSAREALAMVKRAREKRVPVLGVDGFWITENTTEPDMEHMLDVSGDPHHGWDEARKFIEDRAATGLMFEVVEDE